MFISHLTIKNYKAFHHDDPAIPFRVPDGTNPGSGLNILVGENGTGKTSVLECLSFLTQSKFSTQNKLSISDFHDDTSPIEITAVTDQPFRYAMPEIFRGTDFECSGFHFLAEARKEKERGKLLSDPLRISVEVINTTDSYATPTDRSDKKITGFHRIFEPSRLSDDLSIFFFDKHRTRQISKGTFTTTFSRIIDDLNWKFLKELRSKTEAERKSLAELSDKYFSELIGVAQKGSGSKVAKATQEFFGNNEYENIKIDFLNLLWPFSEAFFSLREADNLSQIRIAKLGSGIEMIFTLLLLKSISDQSKGSIIYLIDEPEISLHPQAQQKLLELLIAESRHRQIIISTHSPYFIKPALIPNVLKFERNDGAVTVCAVPAGIDFATKERDVLDISVRELFFAKKVLCVEGKGDVNRYIKFFSANIPDFDDWTVIKMAGKQGLKKYKKALDIFCPDHKIILDLDAICSSRVKNGFKCDIFKDLLTSAESRVIRLAKTTRDELLDRQLKEDELKQKAELLHELYGHNIYVLSAGQLEDYLDADGNVMGADKTREAELLSFFDSQPLRQSTKRVKS